MVRRGWPCHGGGRGSFPKFPERSGPLSPHHWGHGCWARGQSFTWSTWTPGSCLPPLLHGEMTAHVTTSTATIPSSPSVPGLVQQPPSWPPNPHPGLRGPIHGTVTGHSRTKSVRATQGGLLRAGEGSPTDRRGASCSSGLSDRRQQGRFPSRAKITSFSCKFIASKLREKASLLL